MPASDDLAILGGTPVSAKGFGFNRSIGAEEKAAVMRVLDSGELSGFIASPGEHFWGGREVRALERMFEERYGIQRALAFNSATTALHAAVAATGVGPGDEVIVSPYTMSASATAILMTGAVPVFADVEARSFGLDPESVAANITPHTRGILVVNIFGHPAQLGPLREIADRHGLFLIEDNAQAPDGLYQGRHTGTIGDIGVFSFNRHKVMQCGEGGVLVTGNERLATKAALVRNHGEVVVEPMGIDDIANTVGLNYRMTEMEAAVAQEQFRKMPTMNARRIELANRLADGLRGIPGLKPPIVEAGCRHVYYMFPILLDADVVGLPRDLFAKAVAAEGYYLRAGYLRPIYLEPVYQSKICFGGAGFPFTANPRNANLSYAAGICPIVERLQGESLMITPIMQPPQDEADMDGFVEACAKVIRNRDRLLAARERLGA
ncbi:MAG: DegT/DnrJ/EryC1/StrS family aminotransferase [Alphaproteobacteria bacterium]